MMCFGIASSSCVMDHGRIPAFELRRDETRRDPDLRLCLDSCMRHLGVSTEHPSGIMGTLMGIPLGLWCGLEANRTREQENRSANRNQNRNPPLGVKWKAKHKSPSPRKTRHTSSLEKKNNPHCNEIDPTSLLCGASPLAQKNQMPCAGPTTRTSPPCSRRCRVHRISDCENKSN